MANIEAIGYNTTNLTASAAIQNNPGGRRLGGIFCASSTAGTVKIWDNTAASGTVVVNTFSVTAGTWYNLPAQTSTGLFITIGGTADITVFWL